MSADSMPLVSPQSVELEQLAHDRLIEILDLKAQLARAQTREAKWLRAFNSLEKPVTNHIERCIDADDLDRAHRAVMRKFGP